MRRILYGFLLFGAAFGSLIIGGLVWPLMLGLAAYMAGEEFIAMTRAKGIHVSPRIIRSMIIAFFAVTAMQQIPGLHLPWNFSIEHFPILLTIGVCTSFIRLL